MRWSIRLEAQPEVGPVNHRRPHVSGAIQRSRVESITCVGVSVSVCLSPSVFLSLSLSLVTGVAGPGAGCGRGRGAGGDPWAHIS
jgi:hypothetical protein